MLPWAPREWKENGSESHLQADRVGICAVRNGEARSLGLLPHQIRDLDQLLC
jgi:hypothetical protein